jgi:hypothetical protein
MFITVRMGEWDGDDDRNYSARYPLELLVEMRARWSQHPMHSSKPGLTSLICVLQLPELFLTYMRVKKVFFRPDQNCFDWSG